MAAVLVAPEFRWMEAGRSSDVVVKDNLIESCLKTPIQILAHSRDARPLLAGAHRNISILSNRLRNCP